MQIDQLGADFFIGNLCFFATLATLQHSSYFDVDTISFLKGGDNFRRCLFVVFEEYNKGYKRSGCASFHDFILYNECNYDPPESEEFNIK